MNIHLQYILNLARATKHLKEENARWTENNRFHGIQRYKAYSALEKVTADYVRIVKGHSKIVPLLKKAGLPIGTSTSTAIKGHRDYTLGFKVYSDSTGVRIGFQSEGYTATGTYRELTEKQIDKAVEVLTGAGYEINRTDHSLEIISFTF